MKSEHMRQMILEALVGEVCNDLKVDAEYEHKFHEERKWRFDVAWPSVMVALEIEGGVWSYGRHNRAVSFLRDMEKYNEAASIGWLVLRCPWEWVENGSMLGTIKKTIRHRLNVVEDNSVI